MAGVLRNIFKRERPEIADARGLYRKLMTQSRQAEFYGKGRVPDSYDGRIDFLTLHMSIVMNTLGQHGDNGSRLSQALYDVMIDDFDVALREEGLSDTGVVRRIKPMANLFFTRLKAYSEAFDQEDGDVAMAITSSHKESFSETFQSQIIEYVQALRKQLKELPLGSLAKADFQFPTFN